MRKLLVLTFIILLTITPSIAQEDAGGEYVQVGQLAGRGQITESAWSPDGSIIAVGSADGVWLYDSDLNDIAHLESTSTEYQLIGKVAWSSDGRFIAGTNGFLRNPPISSDPIIHIWDVTTGTLVTTFDIPDNSVAQALFWDMDGSQVVVFAESRPDDASYLLRWDVETGEELLSVQYEQLDLGNFRLSDDGTLLIADNLDSLSDVDAYQFDLATGDMTSSEEISPAQIISPDGAYIANLNRNELHILDATTDEVLHTFVADEESRFVRWATATWVTDTLLVSLILQTNTLVIFDVTTGERLAEQQYPPNQPIIDMIPNLNGEQLLVTRSPAHLQVLALPSGDVIANRAHDIGWVAAFSWSPDQSQVVVSSNNENQASVWDIESERVVMWLEGDMTDDTVSIRPVAWSPDGKIIAAGARVPANDEATHGNIYLWDAVTGELIRSLTYEGVFADQVAVLKWSPDGTKLLASTASNFTGMGRVIVWDVATGVQEFQIIFEAGFTGGDWNPDGNSIVFAQPNLLEDTYHLQTWESDASPDNEDMPLSVVELPDNTYYVVWRPNTQQVLTHTQNEQITLWDMETNTQITNLESNDQWFAWRSDGQVVASVLPSDLNATTGTINIWSVDEAGTNWQLIEAVPIEHIIATFFFPIVWAENSDCFGVGLGDGVVGGVRIWCGE